MPHRTVSVAVGVLLLLAARPATAQTLWDESYREGLAAFAAGQYETAGRHLETALHRRPNQGRNVSVPGRRIDYLPELYLGLIAAKQGRFSDAHRLLQKSLATDLVREVDPEYRIVMAGLDEIRRGNLESFRARTVKIEALRADDSLETGTGIIVATGPDGAYVLTALHVLMLNDRRNQAPRRITVSFHGGEHQPLSSPVPGIWLDGKFNSDLDIAAIRVPASRDVADRLSSWELRKTPLAPQDRIFTVGHAIQDYTVSSTNVVLASTEPDSRHFTFTTAGIGERASGGPVIDDRGYLAGLMVELVPQSGKGVAVHVNELADWMGRWNILDSARTLR